MANPTPTSQRLLSAAMALILERGYNAFSYADLSVAVGIRKASIHHHFPTKAELVATLVKTYRQTARDMIAGGAVPALTPRDKLEAFVGYWTACIAERSQPICLAVLLAAELPSLPDMVAVEVRGHFADLSAWLASVFAEGGEAASDARAEAFMAAVHGAMLSARAYGDPKVFQLVTAQALEGLPF